MRRHLVTALLAALPAAVHPQARPAGEGTPVDRGVAADHAGTVTIVNWLGSVRVVGWDRDSVHVGGLVVAGFVNDSLLVTRTPERGVRIRRALADLAGGANVSGGTGAAELVVQVPAHSHVVVDGHQTSIDVSDVLGKLELAANVDGAMHVAGTPSELDAYVAGSDIDLDVTTPYLRARSGSGRIAWKGSSEDVSLSTVTGRITARVGMVGRARFESTSGDIRFSGGLGRSASVTMDTHGGDIVAEFVKGTEAQVIMNAAIIDAFGTHGIGDPDPAKRVSVVHALGRNQSADVQLSSFKGRITASVADSSPAPSAAPTPAPDSTDALAADFKVDPDGLIRFDLNRPAYVAIFEVRPSAIAQVFPEIAPQAARAVTRGTLLPLRYLRNSVWAGPLDRWARHDLRTFVLIASARPLRLGARFDVHRLRYALEQAGHKMDLDLLSGMNAMRAILAPGMADSDIAMQWTTVLIPYR